MAEGDAALARNDFTAAEAAYQRAVAADASYAPAHVGLAWTYAWQIGRSKDALAAAQRATELAPEGAAAWAALGDAQDRRNNRAEAAKAAEKAVVFDPATVMMLARSCPARRAHDSHGR